MKDKFTRVSFERLFDVEKIITIFYMEFSKNFQYEGESHDFWEMVYIDKGEMICTADKTRFVLKSGEITFHKPNEYHNLSGNNSIAPNSSIVTFECNSPAMEYFEGKIFKLVPEEKAILSNLFTEGLSSFKLVDETNPLLQNLEKLPNAPIGGDQMIKNLLEIFLIKLCRRKDALSKTIHRSYLIDDVHVPYDVKEILDILNNNIYSNLTIADIASQLGKSESTVKSLFSQYKKGGIIRFYNSLKIEEAKKLLREGNYNIAKISDVLHFDTPQYFAKCFKRFTKMTPTEYTRSIVQ